MSVLPMLAVVGAAALVTRALRSLSRRTVSGECLLCGRFRDDLADGICLDCETKLL